MGANDALGKSPAPAALLQNMLDSANNTLGTPSEPVIRTLNDHPAAWITITDSSDDGLFLMVMDMKLKLPNGQGQYVLLMGTTAADEFPALKPTLEAMAETIRLKLNT